MAGRKPGFRHNEETRAKIQASNLIIRLYEHVMASQPIMDATQVNAAKALLNKVLPDLSAVSLEHSGHIDTNLSQATDAELEAIALARPQHEGKTIN